MEKALADSIDAITKIVEKLSKGLIEDDDAAAILPGLRAVRNRCKRELAAEPPKHDIISIRPKAIENFQKDIECLAETLSSNNGQADPDISMRFRQVVSKIILAPRQPGDNYFFEIKGNLTNLVGEDTVVCFSGSGRPLSSEQTTAEQEEISLGTWQVSLIRAVRGYLAQSASSREAENSNWITPMDRSGIPDA